MSDEHELDFEYEDGVFTDKDEAVQALRRSAEELGLNPDLVAPDGAEGEDGPRYRYYARGGCKHCFGRGVINVVLSPSKEKIFWKNEGLPGRVPHRKIRSVKKLKRRKQKKYDTPVRSENGPTPPKRKVIFSFAPPSEVERNTRKPEPFDFKSENMAQSFCRCVRAIEI